MALDNLTKPLSKESARLLSFDCHSMSNSSDCLNYCISCILLILFTKSWIVTLQPTQSWNDYRSSKKISISLNPFASISCWTYPVRDVLVCAKTGNFLKYKKIDKFWEGGVGGGKYKVNSFKGNIHIGREIVERAELRSGRTSEWGKRTASACPLILACSL